MKRLQKAAILAELTKKMREHGSWCGETHIQKAVYILQELLLVPFGFTYILYKHGPFSFDLRDEITDLRAYELFKLETRPIPYGPSLRPTTNAEELKKRYAKTMQRYANHINFVAKCLEGKGVADLERLATALYVTLPLDNGNSGSDVQTRAQKITALKPHVSLPLALKAINEIDRLRNQAKESNL
jgi:uncharacterized protein YwgA